MSINPTTLKAQIDTEITNETVDFAITPAEVGGRMKDIIDYSTQIAIVKVQKTTITSAQILNLFTTPITILDNSETDVVKIPTGVYIKRNAGVAYYTSSYFFNIVNDFGTNTGQISSNILGYTVDCFIQSLFGQATQSFTQSKATSYKLKANNVDPITGTGDIDVYITYTEVTL